MQNILFHAMADLGFPARLFIMLKTMAPTAGLTKPPEQAGILCHFLHWRIPEITQRWVSETVRDSVAATDMNRSLAAPLPHRVLAAVLPSPNEHVVD